MHGRCSHSAVSDEACMKDMAVKQVDRCSSLFSHPYDAFVLDVSRHSASVDILQCFGDVHASQPCTFDVLRAQSLLVDVVTYLLSLSSLIKFS